LFDKKRILSYELKGIKAQPQNYAAQPQKLFIRVVDAAKAPSQREGEKKLAIIIYNSSINRHCIMIEIKNERSNLSSSAAAETGGLFPKGKGRNSFIFDIRFSK